MFKNIVVYQIGSICAQSLMQDDKLLNAITTQSFKPCGEVEMVSMGFVEPVKHGGLIHKVEGQLLLKVQTEKRLLPSSVVNDKLEKAIEQMEFDLGYTIGRKSKRELKEDIIVGLMPHAFTSKSSVDVWIDTKNGWLVIDTPSVAKSDEVLRLLLRSIQDFDIEMVRTKLSPSSAMTEWLIRNEAPYHFTVDNGGELKSHQGGTVKYIKNTLAGNEVRDHIATGKKCTKLALTWNDKVSLILTETFQIKRLELLDVLMDKADEIEEDERFDGEFLLMTGELNLLFVDLIDALGGSPQAEVKE